MRALRTLAVSLCIAVPGAALAQDDAAPFVCATHPSPVVILDHGSRYTTGSTSRSDFDAVSNADVNAQLKPVDSFISTLAAAANTAVLSDIDRAAALDCVMSGLTDWAKADALSDLGTLNAQLSAPSRVAGFSFVYAQVQPLLPPSADTAEVERWLARRAQATMDFFDEDAPPKASKNNLRAWAALAVARIGVTLQDQALMDWADASVRLVVCEAREDGSLPLEMARGDLALHYQMHAVAPLVVTAALLQTQGHTLFVACNGSIRRTIGFVIAAFETPSLVEGLAGEPQTYFNGKEELKAFELAWADAYLSLFHDPQLAAFVEPFGTLGNSKLGGKQALLWGG